MRLINADLHIHTCLSPCAELEMSPMGIVKGAIGKGIDMIAICDHNSAENTRAVIEAAEQTGLTVLPGMEVTSKEEVHILSIFSLPEDAARMQELVYNNLEGVNDESAFGMQVIVEADGTVTGCNDRLLIGATDMSLEHIVRAIHMHHGLAIAAHIDRPGFGILGQLGFIPNDLDLDALEISARISIEDATTSYSEYSAYPIVRSSDAHFLDAIGSGMTPLMVGAASFTEFQMALRGEQGRYICYEG